MLGQVELAHKSVVSPRQLLFCLSWGLANRSTAQSRLWSESTLPCDCSPTLVGACSKCRCLGSAKWF